MWKMMSTALPAAILMVGCMTEVDRQDETEGENEAQTEQAFTGNWSYSWGSADTSAADIGTSVGRTCFLTGIGGHFRPLGAYLYSGGALPAMAGVRKKANGNYELYVQPEDGHHLIAYARCVNSAAGRVEVSWTSGQQASGGDKIIGSSAGGRQCFLQDIKNFPVALKDSTGAIYSYSWAFDDVAHPDEIRVVNDGSYWKMWVKPGAHTYPVNIWASAVCINAPEFHGGWSWKAAESSTTSINLTSAAGATCGITGINGHFDADLGDWNDAVFISTVGSQFKMNLANGKRGYAACMK